MDQPDESVGNVAGGSDSGKEEDILGIQPYMFEPQRLVLILKVTGQGQCMQ